MFNSPIHSHGFFVKVFLIPSVQYALIHQKTPEPKGSGAHSGSLKLF